MLFCFAKLDRSGLAKYCNQYTLAVKIDFKRLDFLRTRYDKTGEVVDRRRDFTDNRI